MNGHYCAYLDSMCNPLEDGWHSVGGKGTRRVLFGVDLKNNPLEDGSRHAYGKGTR